MTQAQPPAPLTEMKLPQQIKEAVNNAFTSGKPVGGLQKALGKNPRISLMYRDPTPESRTMLQFKGKARVGNDAERETVYNNAPEPERNADREKKGFPLIIDLERVDGFAPGMRVAMRK